MSIRQPMVSDPHNIGHYITMDTLLEELDSGKEKLIRRAITNYESCLSRIKAFANDSTVCRRFIDITFDHFPSYIEEAATKIMDNVDKNDTSVLLYLANKLIDVGNQTLASSIFDTLCPGQDLALREYVLGRMTYSTGNATEAEQHFLRVVLTDPTMYDAYSYLDESDPGFGWLYMANVIRVLNGEDPVMYDGLVGGDREDLFNVCQQWSDGDWNGSIAAIRRIHSFHRDDPFTLAVFARMSVRLGSYRDAVEAYTRSLDVLKDSEYISLGLAEVYEAIGDYDSSTALLKRIRTFNPNSSRILVTKYISLLNDGRRQDAEHMLESLMSSAGLDAEDLERCIETLRAHGMGLEALNLTKRVSIRCIDRAFAECLLATDALANRNYRSVISHANSALRVDKGCIRARCLRVKAYLETDGVTRAMQDVNRMLDESPGDLRVLDVKKDIHIAIGHYDDALELCDLMLSIDPRCADVMRDRAIILGLMGDHRGSLDSYREALNIREDVRLFTSILTELLKHRRVDDLCRLVDDFDDVFGRAVIVWRLRGNAEYACGRFEDAATSFGKAVELSPNEGDIWHSKGLAEEAAEMYADAEDSYGRALLVDLDNTDYWISKAVIQEKRGNLKGAIASLNKVISSSENGVFPLTMKARLLARCGRAREALYFLDQAQRIEPNNIDVMRMRKDTHLHLMEYDRVIDLCRRINSITGGDYNATSDLISALLVADDRDSATELLNRLAEKRDLSPEILSDCAYSYHQIGDFDNEVVMLERALAHSDDDRDLMLRLAEAYAVSGDRAKASEMYERLEEDDPDDVSITVRKVMLDVESEAAPDVETVSIVEDSESLMDLAQRTMESGMVDDALHIYRKVVDEDPDCVDAHVAVLEIMMGRGETIDVIAMGSESSHLFPNDPRILKVMGDAYRIAGDNDRAVESYTNAMKLGMDTAEVHESVGLALEDIGLMRMALDNYRIASEKEPQNLEYRLNIAALEFKVGHDDVAENLLNSVLAMDHRNIRALRMYVSICCRRNDSEAVLALFDDIMSVAVMDDDIRFFESALRDLGENAKADRVGAKLLF